MMTLPDERAVHVQYNSCREDGTRLRLVGEPTGGTPDGIQPDLFVPALPADWFAGRDAVLDAALARPQ